MKILAYNFYGRIRIFIENVPISTEVGLNEI